MESNIDTGQFASNDSVDQSKKKKKIVPTEVISWVIDPVYGTRTPVDVDTLQHEFQNKAYGEGLHGEYNTLGNLGSPRETRLFMDRTMHAHDFLPIATMSQAIEQPSDYRHFNTKSPYMNEDDRLRQLQGSLYEQCRQALQFWWNLPLHVWSRLL